MKPVCLVIGAGAGIGGTVAARFAQEGYHACLCRRTDLAGLNRLVDGIRSDGGSASGFLLDATAANAIEDQVAAIEADIGPIEVVVFASKGIHVAHVVIDGAVDAPDTLRRMLGPEGFQTLRETRGYEHDGLLLPAHIADTYFHLASQHRSTCAPSRTVLGGTTEIDRRKSKRAS